jgi:O-antigen/teichoic acid export membrane protein
MLTFFRRSWIGQGMFAFLDQATYSGSSFVVTVLLARWLAPDEFGAYSIAFAILLFAGMFQTSLILEPLSVFGVRNYSDRFFSYLRILARWQLGPTLVIGVAVATIAIVGSSLIPAPWPGVTLGAAIATPAILAGWLVRRAFYVVRKPASAFFNSLLQSIATLGTLFFLVFLLGASALTAFLALAIGAALGTAVGWQRLRSSRGINPSLPVDSREASRKHWVYGKWLAMSSLFHWAMLYGYTLWVALLLGLTDVAGLRAMQALITPAAVLIASLGSLVLPWFVGRYDAQGMAWLQGSLLRTGGLFAILCLLLLSPVLFLGPPIDNFLYEAKYSAYLWLIPYLVIAQVVGTGSMALSLALRCLEESQRIFYSYVVAGISVLVSGYPAVYWLGLKGIGLSIIFSQVIFAGALLVQWGSASTANTEPVVTQGETSVIGESVLT